jgi:hypothetical protein
MAYGLTKCWCSVKREQNVFHTKAQRHKDMTQDERLLLSWRALRPFNSGFRGSPEPDEGLDEEQDRLCERFFEQL